MPNPRAFAALAVVLLALLACKSRKAPDPAPVASVAPLSTGPCPMGKSVDPGKGEFRPAITAFKDKDYKTAQKLLDNLATAYPNSATVLVWRGEAAMYDAKVKDDQAAKNGLEFFDKAVTLRDKGCTLPDVEDYYLRFDRALAFLRLKDADKALAELTVSKQKWDNSAELFYNAARAECLKKDVDACVADFKQSLVIAKALRRPLFLRSHHSVDDWIRRSRTQSEFVPLHRDPRYAKTIKEISAD